VVALPEFLSCQQDETRIQFLYSRIWQRPPRPEELSWAWILFPRKELPIALRRIAMRRGQSPMIKRAQQGATRLGGQATVRRRGGRPRLRRRPPLSIWEEYPTPCSRRMKRHCKLTNMSPHALSGPGISTALPVRLSAILDRYICCGDRA